jgi:diaminohydroxyphosphoribosylaminopyrimidine deaminase/5-amino-6-(5-phosphoribosylamino)uracil reductase
VRQPLRVLLDPALSCAPAAKIFQGAGAVVFAAPDAPASALRVERVACRDGGLDLDAVLRRLTAFEVNEVLVECGPRLAAAFLRAGLVDELLLYVAPIFLGVDALPLADFRGADVQATDSEVRAPQANGLDAITRGFEFEDVRRIGADVRLILKPKKKA